MRSIAVGPHKGTQALANFREIDPAKVWLKELMKAADEHTWEDGAWWRATTNHCSVEFLLEGMKVPVMRWWIAEDKGDTHPRRTFFSME